MTGEKCRRTDQEHGSRRAGSIAASPKRLALAADYRADFTPTADSIRISSSIGWP